jgi:3-oxoacyl-[acyl-carrier protein] reductase
MNQLDLNGRTAVVTGGAAGIGYAIAQRLLASGARVALWDRDERALENAQSGLGGSTLVYPVDVTDAGAVDRVCGDTNAGMDGIDILVCSAGITGPNKPTW